MASAADRFIIERSALTRSPAVPAVPGTPPKDSGIYLVDPGDGTTQYCDGMRTANLQAIVVSCLANASQTLSGAGTLDCWIFDDPLQLWARLPELDLQVNWPGPGSTTVRRYRKWPAIRVPARLGGRVLFAANGVTVSGGTDILIKLEGFTGTWAS